MSIEVTKLPPAPKQDEALHRYACTAEDGTSAEVYADNAGAAVDIPALTGPLAEDSAAIELTCNLGALDPAVQEAIIGVVGEAVLKIAAINQGITGKSPSA